MLPSPAVSSASTEAMVEDVDDCLKGDSVIDPIVHKESVLALAMAEPSACLAFLDDANVLS